jgi:hypothetical protein
MLTSIMPCPLRQAEQQRLKREADSMAVQTPEAAAEVPPNPQGLPAAPVPSVALAHQQRSQSHQLMVQSRSCWHLLAWY